MKKFIGLLFILPLLMTGFASCDSDNDTPDVTLGIAMTNGKNIDGQIYMVAGDTLYIDSVTCINNEKDKNAMVTQATYFWNGFRLGTNVVYPYGFAIATEAYTNVGDEESGTRPGQYLLAIETPVLAEGKSLAVGVQTYVVNVVASVEDIPSDPGTSTANAEPTFKD